MIEIQGVRYRNLTPHVVNHCPTGIAIPSDGEIRVEETAVLRDDIAYLTPGDLQLPPALPGVRLIVSRVVLEHPAAAGRDDLVMPYPLVRDEVGRIIGCNGFARLAPRGTSQATDHRAVALLITEKAISDGLPGEWWETVYNHAVVALAGPIEIPVQLGLDHIEHRIIRSLNSLNGEPVIIIKEHWLPEIYRRLAMDSAADAFGEILSQIRKGAFK